MPYYIPESWSSKRAKYISMDMLRYLLNSGLALMAGLEEHRVSVTLKQ